MRKSLLWITFMVLLIFSLFSVNMIGITVAQAPSMYTRTYLPNEWITGGVAMGWHEDDNSWPYTLPFNFPFYDTYYTTIYISSNGLITFISPDSSYDNSIEYLSSELAIAPAWDDWVTYSPHDIYIWQPDSTHIVIRWEVAAHDDPSIAANFEAILGVDGVIQFNYGYNNGTISATVGISNGVDDILAEDITTSNYIASTTFAVIDVTPLDVEIDVGAIHFRGELAEFYAQTAFKGVAVNATSINALLYKPDGATEALTAQWVATGFYKISYEIPGDAPTGTYALVIETSYTTSTVEANGTSFKSFLLSPTLTGTLISLNETVAWIKTDVGIIKTDIANIELEVTEINGDIATIQTTLGTIEGRITSIEGSIATIETDIGTVKVDISKVKGAQEAVVTPLYIVIVPALIAAAGAILAIVFIRRKPKT